MRFTGFLFAGVAAAIVMPAHAIEVTASPNATMNDALAIGTRIDATAAAAQAAYTTLNTKVTAILNCMASNQIYNQSTNSCAAVGTDTNVTAFLNRQWTGFAASARNKDVVYQNTLSYPIEVSVVLNGNRKCSAEFEIAGAAGGPFVRVARSNIDMAQSISGQSAGCLVNGSVPPGKYYRATSTYGSDFGTWAEMR